MARVLSVVFIMALLLFCRHCVALISTKILFFHCSFGLCFVYDSFVGFSFYFVSFLWNVYIFSLLIICFNRKTNLLLRSRLWSSIMFCYCVMCSEARLWLGRQASFLSGMRLLPISFVIVMLNLRVLQFSLSRFLLFFSSFFLSRPIITPCLSVFFHYLSTLDFYYFSVVVF